MYTTDVRYRGSDRYSTDAAFILPGYHDDHPSQKKQKNPWIKRILIAIPLTIFLFFLILFLIPSGIDPVYFELESPPEFSDALKPNQHLTGAVRLFENEIIGPESLAYQRGAIYATTYTGEIVKIVEDKIVGRLSLGPSCAPKCSPSTEERTGRPLGIRASIDGWLIVVNAYHGIVAVNFEANRTVSLISPGAVINGRKIGFLNDVVIHDSGVIFFTESSNKWQRRQFPYIMLEGKHDGRLLSFNPKTGYAEELLDRLAFPNGIEVADNGTALLIAETFKARILKYQLPQNGQPGSVKVFASSLPGFPDNIRRGSINKYWVAFAGVRLPGRLNFVDFTSTRPWLRKLIAKVEWARDHHQVIKIQPIKQGRIKGFEGPGAHNYSDRMIPERYMLSLFGLVKPAYGLVIELDGEGRVLFSLHDPKGLIVADSSEVLETDHGLYLGSYHLPYLLKVPYF